MPSSREVPVEADETTIADFALEPEPVPNEPPVLEPIGDHEVVEGSLLTFEVAAEDPESDALTFECDGLPAGASFVEQVFSWTPAIGQAGEYEVMFIVSDGEATDSETITITVTPAIVTGTVEGTVVDAVTGEPVAGALVTAGERSATSDESGGFAIEELPAGVHTIAASADGYEEGSVEAGVTAGETTFVGISLSPTTTPASPMWVESIDLELSPSGKLRCTVLVVEPSPVRRAQVTLSLTRDGVPVLTETGSTSPRGTVRFDLRGAEPGQYVATVEALEHRDYEWDASRGVVSSTMDVGSTRNKMWVESIDLKPMRRGELRATVNVAGDGPVDNAMVTVAFTVDGEQVATMTGETSKRGVVRFRVRDAGHGEFLATVVGLEHPGLEWNESEGVLSASLLL